MVKQEEEWNTATKELAKLEMENDELKNDVRQMGYMVQDLEQKLDAELEINELLNTEQEEMKNHMEDKVTRLKQQLEEIQEELQAKEKEIKKIKLTQLMVETQQTFTTPNAGLNNTQRSSSSVYQKGSQPLLPASVQAAQTQTSAKSGVSQSMA